ncbi:MAG: dihydrodipicolinate synthase family protein [Actinobacteria bacterium]|nr:dihydrodipicolinate synthase family protein [Actinomycetota bacterium]
MRGLFVPQFTAFKKNNEVDFQATVEHGEYLLSQGVSGLVPFGTFGEGSSLSLMERKKVTEGLASIIKDKALIPCIISNSLGDIWEYLDFAKDIPLKAIMVLPPCYFKPIDNQSLIDFFKEVAERSVHPIVAYNLPAFSMKIDSEVAVKSPIWGVKDSSGDFESALDFIKNGMKILLGSDDLLVKGIAAGARGGICGLANFFPVQMVKIFQLASSGVADDVVEAQNILDKIFAAVNSVVKKEFAGVQSIGALKNASPHFMPTNMGDMRSPSPTYRSPESDISRMVELAKIVYDIS